MVKRKHMHRHVHAWSHSQTYRYIYMTFMDTESLSQRDGHTVVLEIHTYKINMHGHAWSLTVVPCSIHVCIHRHIHSTCIHDVFKDTHTHMDKHKHMHGHMNDVGIDACMDTHIQITHTHVHGHTHTHTHTCMDTNTHTETWHSMYRWNVVLTVGWRNGQSGCLSSNHEQHRCHASEQRCQPQPPGDCLFQLLPLLMKPCSDTDTVTVTVSFSPTGKTKPLM